MRAYLSRGRIHNRAASAVLAALVALPAAAQYEGGGAERAATFDTATTPGYGDPRAGLRVMMRDHRTHRRGAQHFCVVGYRYKDGDRNAYILWREGRRQILWEPHADPLDRVNEIAFSRRNLDLDHDVVADSVTNTSTFAIFRHEERAVARDCARAGRPYVVRYPTRRVTGGRAPSDRSPSARPPRRDGAFPSS